MAELHFDKITVLGVGLIGGSIALGLREKGLCRRVAGFGRSAENLVRARDLGIIDEFSKTPAEACEGSDLVILSTPVGSFSDLIRKAAPALKSGAIVTDAGSVKGRLVRDIEELVPENVSYIGAHPIAGSDRSGIDYSSPRLFADSKCIITPTERSDKGALSVVTDLWKALGADVLTMEPERHDQIYAAVSHLPHIIAYALMNTIADIDGSFLGFSGQGLKDTTRIAASSHELWRDICLLNRENIIDTIGVFQKKLDSMIRYLQEPDPNALDREFQRARTLREGLGQD